MARTKYCPVCDGTHFRKVCVTLPSGKMRETEFVYCCRCELAFYRPPEPVDPPRPPPSHENGPPVAKPFLASIPADEIAIAEKLLPAVESAADDVQHVTVETPSRGRVKFTFKRFHARHYKHRYKFWRVEGAEKIITGGPDPSEDDIET